MSCEGGCKMTVKRVSNGWWTQHGDNPEARKFWSFVGLARMKPDEAKAAIADWLRAACAYEQQSS